MLARSAAMGTHIRTKLARYFVTGTLLALLAVARLGATEDPFADGNAAPSKKSAKRDATVDLLRFDFSVEPVRVRRGDTFRLTITGTPKAGYHTFPLTQCS